jgi:hypothetical protein
MREEVEQIQKFVARISLAALVIGLGLIIWSFFPPDDNGRLLIQGWTQGFIIGGAGYGYIGRRLLEVLKKK